MERVTVGASVAALCVGLMVGGVVTYGLQPEKSPAACQRMAGTDVLDTTGAILTATLERASETEWHRRSVLAGEIERLTSLLAEQAPAYDRDRAACLEAS